MPTKLFLLWKGCLSWLSQMQLLFLFVRIADELQKWWTGEPLTRPGLKNSSLEEYGVFMETGLLAALLSIKGEVAN